MNKTTPTLLSRIYTWIYGRIYTWIYGDSNFRENTYVLLDESHRPHLECWNGNPNLSHTSHVSEPNPTLGQLASLGNYLSDRINWLFEVIGKINITQSEVANEINLKLDLAENTLNRVYEQIPTNFAEVVTHQYETICEIRKFQEKMFHDMELLNQEIHRISLRISGIEKAIGADLCGNP